MSDRSEAQALRLECLRLALARSGAADARSWRAIADDFHAWVAGEGAAPADAPDAAPCAGRAPSRGQARAGGTRRAPAAGPRRQPTISDAKPRRR